MQHASHEHKQTVVLVDLDHTLFNAQAFKEDLRATVLVVTDLRGDQYDQAYTYLRQTLNRGFSQDAFEAALQDHGVSWSSESSVLLERALAELTRDTAMYVFPDVAQFIRTMHTWDARPVLVSYGDRAFQHMKLHGSGLEAFIPDVRFAEASSRSDDDSKTAMISMAIKDYPDSRFAYIDDRGHLVDQAKRAFPEMIACHMKRPGSAYEDSVSELADHELTTLQRLPYVLASCLDCT